MRSNTCFFISENIYLIVLLWKQYHTCVNIPWCEIPEWIKLLIYNVHNLKSLVVFFFTTIYLLSSVKSHELCIPPPNACCSYHGVVYIFLAIINLWGIFYIILLFLWSIYYIYHVISLPNCYMRSRGPLICHCSEINVCNSSPTCTLIDG